MAKIGVQEKWTLASSYVLMNDITLTNWTPIGDDEKPFNGIFNGNERTITVNGFSGPVGRHLVSGTTYVNDAYVGIFGAVKGASDKQKAKIENLKIYSTVNTSSTDGQAIGLLAGYVENAEIDNITLSGQLTFSSGKTLYLGGVVGLLRKAGTVIKNCKSSLTMNISPGASSTLVNGVIAYDYVGGFVGLFYEGAGIENCHNTGNITADNTTNSVSGQVFVGGITGGSSYAFDTSYKGYIQDCSYVGTVIGKAKGSWTFAGGIAGTIVGGDVDNNAATTRVERCFANGTVSVAGTSSGFPYIGGIVGYNYYGALVSQCYFNGTVIADKTNDYTGGIAGYNSQTGAPNNSRIEDCWSAGEVKGFNNAGGIVGQNQVNTYIRRCYSTAAISVTNQAGTGIGGIAGMNASTQTDAITACVALNKSLTAPKGNNINRVTGTTGGNRSNNHAWTNMPINAGTGTYTERKGDTFADGADCAEKPVQSFYNSLGWDFTTVWKMSSDGYPQLKWQN
jgi:hypothetical protein